MLSETHALREKYGAKYSYDSVAALSLPFLGSTANISGTLVAQAPSMHYSAPQPLQLPPVPLPPVPLLAEGSFKFKYSLPLAPQSHYPFKFHGSNGTSTAVGLQGPLLPSARLASVGFAGAPTGAHVQQQDGTHGSYLIPFVHAGAESSAPLALFLHWMVLVSQGQHNWFIKCGFLI